MLHLLQHSTAQPVACDLCVYLCETGRVLCCLSVLADTHHMELFTPSTLRPAGHTRTLCTVSVSLSHFVCFHFLQLTLNHFLLFRLSTRCSLPFFSRLSLLLLCLCVPAAFCVCPIGHCFQEVKLCLTGSRWQAELMCVCVISSICQRQVSAVHGQHLPAVLDCCHYSSHAAFALLYCSPTGYP